MGMIFLLLALALAGCAGWSRQEKLMEAAYLTSHAIDWQQTRYIAKHPEEYRELNPILGSHPETWEVDAWFLGTAILHPVVTHYLPKEYRPLWQGLTLGMSMSTVGWNLQMGIKLDF